MKKKLISLIQLGFGLGLIAFFFFNFSAEDKSDLLNTFHAIGDHWLLLVAGVSGFCVCMGFCALRWKWLLEAQGLKLSWRQIIVLYFVGHFFNSFLPGAVSGDFVKAYYVTKETSLKKTEAVSTIFIDRIIGLLGLILLAVTMMLIRLDFFLEHEKMRLALLFNVLLLFGAGTGLFVVFRRNLFERWAIFRRLEQKTVLGEIIGKVYNAFHICLVHPGLLFKTILISILNHTTLIACVFMFSMAMETSLSFLDCMTVFPVINAVGAIPITPGGLGTREAATIYMLGVLNVPAATALALSLLVYISMLFWSLVGGIVYFFYVLKKGRPKAGGGGQESDFSEN